MPIADLLFRPLAITKDRALRVPNAGFALGSETGLRREENQDRVAVCRISRPGSRLPVLTIAILSDGMGGMQGGAECAVITAAEFIQGTIEYLGNDLAALAEHAARAANRRVFERYAGRGGATLSAVIISPTSCATVNIGDSRIYYTDKTRPVVKARLSIDDTMAEAFGSHGQQLIQFVGIGDGLRPHVEVLASNEGTFWLTSDGTHYPNDVFYEVLSKAPDLRAGVERTLALARWLGSPDNASIVGVIPSNIDWKSDFIFTEAQLTVEVHTAEDCHILYQQAYFSPPFDESSRVARATNPRPKSASRKTSKRKTPEEKPPRSQLEIKIDVAGGE